MNEPETTVGHFDRKEALERLLEHHAPPHIDTTSIDEYLSWSPRQRREFNDRRSARIADSIVVETPSMQRLAKECRRASLFAQRDIGRTGVILSGPATMGKTTAARHAMVEAFARHKSRHPDWKDRGHHPVVYVEVPPKCNGKNMMGRFLHFFGLPVLDRDTLEVRTQKVTQVLQASRTSLIVIDEMQNLSGVASAGRFESAQAIKNLMNSIKAVPLYVGINLENSSLTNSDLGSQFAARSTFVPLGRMEIDTPEGRKLWGGVIVSFERQFALLNHPEKTLLPLAKHLWTQTQGSIGALSRLLTVAALELIANDDPAGETITQELLDSINVDLTTERELGIVTDAGATKGM